MIYKVLTLFPEMIRSVMETGIIGRAINEGALGLETFNIRDYSDNKRAQIGDYPYGGGAGQVIQAEPVYRAYLDAIGLLPGDKGKKNAPVSVALPEKRPRCIYLSPQGKRFDQRMARELACEDELIFLCGHYEGIDERVLEEVVTDYISSGDYILTGGELPALTVMDAVSRLIPGVLGNDESPEVETFYRDLLEYPQYSRPEIWHDKAVPYVLTTGNHADIENWRLERSIERTRAGRPDLYLVYRSKEELIGRMKQARVQNIPAIEALLYDDTDILYAGVSYYLLQDHNDKTLYAGGFAKTNPIIDGYDADIVKRTISDHLPEVRDIILLNAPDPMYDGKLTESVMVAFTEKSPLSTQRVREYGEFGMHLKEKVAESLQKGRTYYEFLDPSDKESINNALRMGFYSSRVLRKTLVD
ncbi:MAG: tRNA (guanosine(37)-N1)-methyltransferase TrmD [Lachnospiraceae bacterium]|nr:tRNA (guanosine(37)-N1)-methyltransferase TrmD [Lachnospiraceae bacterium]